MGLWQRHASGLVVPVGGGTAFGPPAMGGGGGGGGGGGSPGRPNEPAGFIPICEHDYSVEPGIVGGGTVEYVPAVGDKYGSWWQSGGSTANLSIGTDGADGESPPNYLRVKFPAGLGDGSAPAFWLGWNPITPDGVNPQTELYTSWWMRVVGNGTDYENQSTGTKLFYIPYMNTNRTNHSYVLMLSNPGSGAGSMNYRTSWKLRYSPSEANSSTGADPGGAINHRQQNVVTSNVIQLGQWHQVEMYIKQNTLTNPPTADGLFKLWVDRVLVSDYSNMRYCSTDNPLGFWQSRWDPVFGGDAGEVKTRDDFIDFDHVYVSGKEGP